MLELAGNQIPETLPEIVDPVRTSLLVWDMEYAIAPNAFNYPEILKNLQVLTTVARRAGVPVFYAQQKPLDLETEEAGPWVRVQMKRARVTDPRKLTGQKEDPRVRDIVEELQPERDDVVFQKHRPDGFIGTDFDLRLRSKGIRSIVVGGVATEGGVEGTARTGRNLGYDVVIVRDCVGSRSKELHELALTLMERAHFDIGTTDEIAAVWGGK
jgi:nicotinamidase-related amidase